MIGPELKVIKCLNKHYKNCVGSYIHQLGLFTLPAQQNFDQNKVVERIEMADMLAKFIKVIQPNVALQ